MSAKRARDEDAADTGASLAMDDAQRQKKAKHGFRVGPENLPDGAWRRKVTKIKKDLITKAKVKKQYAKVKAEHQKQAAAVPTIEDPATAEPSTHPPDDEPSAASPVQIHPERQAMLDAPPSSRPRPRPDLNPNRQPVADDADPDVDAEPNQDGPHQRRPRKQKPDYYTKELAAAERAKQQAEERAAEFARREQERQRRIAERERYRKAMAKAKAPGRDGKPKVGRESKVLLERVRRIMGNEG